ncbi:MAG TPA: energy transducer TonB, partial [Burkholderiales bacterium]|nr:energy transducer TonB [Burkholderiales bacterium]
MRRHLMMHGGDRVLALAVGISILLHGALLSVRFTFPDAMRWSPERQPLEVVLVNAKTRERPSRPQVLAQSNLDRGGNVDED